MRVKARERDLVAMAVAGNHVVVLGWDLPEAYIRAKQILGFAVERRRASDGEVIWLGGFKTFEAVLPNPAPGEPISSFHHPIQSFQWADYTVSPDQSYTYRIVAMAGQPGALASDLAVSLPVITERIDQGQHAVFFNRGAVASQEYARRFQNRAPDEVGAAAFDWLSRGLVEALEAFIASAGDGDELYGAIFEFQNERIFAALKAAHERGAIVRVLYDGDTEREANETALDGSGIEHLTKARTNSGRFAHNKFFVLRRGGRSEEVWTGSTNLTRNGIFGHSNNAHLIRDTEIAGRFFDYWKVLDADKALKQTAEDVTDEFPVVRDVGKTIQAVFSPRRDLSVLDWYADLAGSAKRGLFATFAFGMDDRFVRIYDRTDDVLRFALMERKGNGRNYKKQAAQIDQIRRRPNTVVAVGNAIVTNAFDRWLKEIDRIQDKVNVRFVHTKYMLIDPLGDRPIVLVGSANFSEASTITNDENMLAICGDSSVADIYFGEFIRLFSHYAFRESLTFKHASGPVEALKRKYLVPGPEWIDGAGPASSYFGPGNDRSLRRLYLSGQ